MLQSLSQDTKSIDEYFKEMKLTIIRANVKEDRNAIMARFMNNFNHDIAHIVGLHHYMKLEEMVHVALKVEKQLK
jgi:predicted Zn-dependent protease